MFWGFCGYEYEDQGLLWCASCSFIDMYQRCGGLYRLLWIMHVYQHILNCSLQPRSSLAQNLVMHSVFRTAICAPHTKELGVLLFISLFSVFLNRGIITIIIKMNCKNRIRNILLQYEDVSFLRTTRAHFRHKSIILDLSAGNAIQFIFSNDIYPS